MEEGQNTVFDLMESNQAERFVVRAADLEMEVGANIAEQLSEYPYVGSLVKLGKAAFSYMDYRFIKKLGSFMKNANDIPYEERRKFMDSLSQKDKKRISDYLTQLLYSSEEEAKAELMGEIYKRRLLGEIDTDMMLRLCSIVNRVYINDLSSLGEYLEVSETNNFITDNLIALGVLADGGNIYEESGDGWESTGFGPTKHALNEVGLTLYQIIHGQPIESMPIARITDHTVPSRPLSTSEIEDIWSTAE